MIVVTVAKYWLDKEINMIKFNNSWDQVLKDEFNKEYYLKLREFLKSEYYSREIFPDMYDIFNAFKYTDYKDVKVLLLGQDPYHDVGQAHGLAFSVKPGVKIPPSLLNMYKELNEEMGLFRSEERRVGKECRSRW